MAANFLRIVKLTANFGMKFCIWTVLVMYFAGIRNGENENLLKIKKKCVFKQHP